MPTYEYRCVDCQQVIEDIRKIEDRDNLPSCPVCEGNCERSIAFQGGLQTEHPAWINDHLRAVLQRDGEKPIETRKEHNDYLKANGYIQRG